MDELLLEGQGGSGLPFLYTYLDVMLTKLSYTYAEEPYAMRSTHGQHFR